MDHHCFRNKGKDRTAPRVLCGLHVGSRHASTLRKPLYDTRGSIMIWIVLLGVTLTSVFFFFALRLNMNALIQRQSVEELNKRAFFDSYVGYLMENPSEINGTFEGITVTLTQEVEEIRGVLDVGQELEYPIAEDVRVEWNLCSKNYKMPISIENVVYEHESSTPSCPETSSGYDDAQNLTASAPLKLKAIGAPTYYRITSQETDDTVTDNQWHLTAEMDLGRWKKVRRVEVFGG